MELLVAAGASALTSGLLLLVTARRRKTYREAERRSEVAGQKQRELETEVAARRVLEDALRVSEERFRGMFDNAPIPIAVGDLNGRCVLANKAACDFVGYSPEQIVGKSIEDIVYPEDLHLTTGLFPRLVTGKIPSYTVTRRYRHRTGAIVWAQASVTIIRDGQGQPLYIMGVMADITERKRTEEALRQSEERFRTLAEAIPQLIWTARPDGYCDYFNVQWTDYTGVSLPNSLGVCWTRVLHPAEAVPVVAAWQQARASGQMFDAETRLRRHDGTYRWFKTRALPLRNEHGEVTRWFGSCTDISDIVEAREALARSRVDLEHLIEKRTASLREAVAELEQFSYSITHDMRGPLRAMQGFATLLQRESGDLLTPRSADLLQRIRTASDRLDKLIRDSLNYNKIARQNLPLHPIALERLLEGIVQSYPDLQPPQVDLEITLPRIVVLGNESALTQCFSNLLGNAAKFVAPGTTPHIRVWAEPAATLPGERPPGNDNTRRVRVWIEDNGLGIPPESHDKIFQMFQRLHREDQFPGTGIGLAIVRKAAQRMHGEVGVAPRPGGGSRFWIELDGVEHG